ncbi:MAG TPA: chorismate mutase, partial [Opitutales bacterium]|nr:chorismate mutase [Opitutales bacterium]
PQGLGVVYVPERQQTVLERLNRECAGRITDGALDAIYTEIFSASIALQKALSIGYIGPFPSLGYVVARDHFGKSLAYRSYDTAQALSVGLARGEIDYAVLEDSTFKAGFSALGTWDLVNTLKAPEEVKFVPFSVIKAGPVASL